MTLIRPNWETSKDNGSRPTHRMFNASIKGPDVPEAPIKTPLANTCVHGRSLSELTESDDDVGDSWPMFNKYQAPSRPDFSLSSLADDIVVDEPPPPDFSLPSYPAILPFIKIHISRLSIHL